MNNILLMASIAIVFFGIFFHNYIKVDESRRNQQAEVDAKSQQAYLQSLTNLKTSQNDNKINNLGELKLDTVSSIIVPEGNLNKEELKKLDAIFNAIYKLENNVSTKKTNSDYNANEIYNFSDKTIVSLNDINSFLNGDYEKYKMFNLNGNKIENNVNGQMLDNSRSILAPIKGSSKIYSKNYNTKINLESDNIKRQANVGNFEYLNSLKFFGTKDINQSVMTLYIDNKLKTSLNVSNTNNLNTLPESIIGIYRTKNSLSPYLDDYSKSNGFVIYNNKEAIYIVNKGVWVLKSNYKVLDKDFNEKSIDVKNVCGYNVSKNLFYDCGNTENTFSGAVSICSNKGMRLPTYDETTANINGGVINNYLTYNWTQEGNVFKNTEYKNFNLILSTDIFYKIFKKEDKYNFRCVQ